MIHVVIDTTILRNDPARKKVAFQTLSRLSMDGVVKIHIPHVVRMEFISQQIEQYSKDFSPIRKGIRDLKRKHISEIARTNLNEVNSDIDPSSTGLLMIGVQGDWLSYS